MEGKKEFREKTANRIEVYQKYIASKRQEIEECRNREWTERNEIYIPAEQEIQQVETFSPDLFDRTPQDEDFLCVRLGSGPIESARQVNYKKQEKLETKMKWMLLSTMIPMTILIIVLLVFFWHYTNEYNQLSNNLAVSSEYNANYRNSNNDMSFKDEVDMDIYYVTIGRKGKDGLPTEQVDKAISTVESLKKTTSKKESLRSLKYLTNYLENLKKRMNQLLEIKNYQERQEFVANNTEILTTLFEKEMQNYIYQEATELVQIESQLAGNVRLTIITMCAAILVATAILLRRSFRLTYSITKPISEILHNIKKVGKGEYKTINAVSADSVEIQELDAGTRKMAGRIEGLLENVRKEQEVQHMTELQLIQAQVNPHFLYNTLDTIVWLVEGGMQQDAVDMITSLSVFFRTSLSKGGYHSAVGRETPHIELSGDSAVKIQGYYGI